MKRLVRRRLPKKILAALASLSGQVSASGNPSAEIQLLWKVKDPDVFAEVRRILESMASGRKRCMYCEDNKGTDIEHFWPKTKYPLLAFVWKNYLLACSECNSNFKRTLFPLDAAGEPLLINPIDDDPFEHLSLTPSSGSFVPVTEKGRCSVEVFGLDRGYLKEGRRHAWVALQALIIQYDNYGQDGSRTRQRELAKAIRRHDFGSVLCHLLQAAKQPKARGRFHPAFLEALDRCPEVFGWS